MRKNPTSYSEVAMRKSRFLDFFEQQADYSRYI